MVLELSGDVLGEVSEDGQALWLKDRRGRHVSTYDHLEAWDATGRDLPARMTMRGREVSLEVDDSGATYPVTIDPTLWQQQARLTAITGAAAHDQFGWSVAISGNRAIVGAREDNALVGGTHLGSAYVFVRNGSAWTLEQKLTPSAGVPFGIFGFSVAISGRTVIVGAPFGGDQRGTAYVYVLDDGTGQWIEQARLSATDPMPNDRFGYSVGISGETAIVGSFALGANRTQGAAYVFSRTGGSWTLPHSLAASDPAAGDNFGFSVAISGETVIVGAPIKPIDSKPAQGAAYVFTRIGADWLQQGPRLTGSGGVERDFFGNSVAISGDTAVVEYRNQLNAGTRGAHFFARHAGTWAEEGKISAPNAGSKLGRVGISGETAIVGTSIYSRSGGTWSEQAGFTVNDGDASNSFGDWGVGISGETAIVGAYAADIGTNVNQGAAYVFLRSPDTDGDSLPDDWETNGVHIDGVFIDLKAMGANPLHKDVFVHAEWLQPDPARLGALFKPSPRAMKIVSDAFAIAPVPNPDGRPGIHLHIDTGPDSVMDPGTGAKWGALSRTGADDLPYQALTGRLDANNDYDWTDVDDIKRMHFGPAKRSAVFHYALFCNTQPSTPPDSSGLSRGIGGADLFVSLGHPSWSPPGARSIGTVLEQAGTFMHELGHNLALKHGGFENAPNFKPNYLSVMNYSFQTGGLLRSNGLQRSFDYSRATLAPLNEGALDENLGINDPGMYLTLWRCPAPNNAYNRVFLPSRALDWNLDGVRESSVAGDINCDGMMATLTGFADWPALVFDGGGRIGNAAGAGAVDPMSTPLDEPSRAELLASVPQEVLDEEGVAPLDVAALSRQRGDAPLAVAFDASASTAVSGDIAGWEWDFGDGTTGSGATVAHTYDTPGEYHASVTVTDGSGRVNLVPLLHLVTVDKPPPATPTPLPTPSPTPTGVPTSTAMPTPTAIPTSTPVPTTTPVPTPTPVVSPTPMPTPSPMPMAGDVDPSFSATVTSRDGEPIHAAITQPDGKIIVGGEFESFGGYARMNIARINPDGSCDPTFDPGLVLTDVLRNGTADSIHVRVSLAVYALALQADGKVLVGVQAYRGFRDDVGTTTETVFRLNTDGTRDVAFDANAFEFSEPRVSAIVVQPDGKILVGGSISYGPGGSRTGIARLNTDGSIDPSFTLPQGPPSNVETIAVQPDGKIVIGGNVANVGRIAIARLHPDGSIDAAFDTRDATGYPVSRFDTNTAIRAIAVQPDGKLILAGRLIDLTVLSNPSVIPFARLNPDGSRDTAFSTTFGADSFTTAVHGLALQEDGKIVVGGLFRSTTPVFRHGIARLNVNGTLDTTFDTGSGTSGWRRHNAVLAVALQANGKVIVAGSFDTYQGAFVEGVLQLNQDGSRDQTFDSNGAGQNARVDALVAQADGKLLVGFSPDGPVMKVNSVRRGGIGRLNLDGTTDVTFTPPFDLGAAVNSILLQSDGKIVVQGTIGPVSQVVRLDADGTLDTTFQAAGRPLFIQADGKMLASVGIPFSQATELVRLNPDGSRDDSFSPHFFPNGGAATLVVQADGRMIISGFFYLDDGREARIARLDGDGSFDTTFDPGAGPNSTVRALVLQPDGKIIIGGQFTGYDGTPRNRLARLHPDGSLDDSYDAVNPSDRNVGALALQPDGRLVVGIRHHDNDPSSLSPIRVFRLETDGRLDPSFPITNSGIEPVNGAVNALLIRPDGKVVIGGAFGVVNGVARLAVARLVGATQAPSTPTPTTTISTPTPTATPAPLPTPTPTATPHSSPPPGPEPTPTATPSPEPTGSPSPDPTPASTPTASRLPEPQRALECYRARAKEGTPGFEPMDVQLDDHFESTSTRIVRETSLCNEVSIDAGEEPGSEVGVLACYHLEGVAAGDRARPASMTIANRFGEQVIEFVVSESSERTLCVPAVTAGGSREQRSAGRLAELDRLRCRRVHAKRLVLAPALVLADAFETRRMRVRSIRSLCAPVALDGNRPSGDDLLACYNLAQARGQSEFRPPDSIALESELASQTLSVRNAQRTLCVPTERR